MIVLRYAVVLFAFYATTSAFAPSARADLPKPMQFVGNWLVRKSVDNMTDKIECLANLKGNDKIQLSSDSLFIGVIGTPRSFYYRLDSNPASDLQLVNDTMQQVGAIKIPESAFSEALLSSRLRLKVLTYASMLEFDLNITGIADAHAILTSQVCQ